MLHLLPKPRDVPSLETMLGDIGSPDAKALAKALGVTPRTVRNWRSAGYAPMPVLLALFWLTKWGQQWIHIDLYNTNQMHANQSNVYRHALAKAEKEIADLHEQIERLGQLGDFGSANDPVGGVSGPGPVHPSPQPMTLTFDGFDRAATWQTAKHMTRGDEPKVWRTGT